MFNAALLVKGKKPITFPEETMIGALINFISNRNKVLANHKKNKFQPMPASFGLIPELPKRIKDKKLRYKAYKQRSLIELREFKGILNSQIKQKQTLIQKETLIQKQISIQKNINTKTDY